MAVSVRALLLLPKLRCLIHAAAFEGQDLSCTYLAHHELESKFVIVRLS